eukprot:g8687.t1
MNVSSNTLLDEKDQVKGDQFAPVSSEVLADDHNMDMSDTSANDEDDVEEPLIVRTTRCSGVKNSEDTEQICTPRLLTFDSDSEDNVSQDDHEMNPQSLHEFVEQRKTTSSDPESDLEITKSEVEGEESGDDDEVEYADLLDEEAPRMESLVIDMETSRQRALREMAAYDRIGKKYLPAAETPFDLISRLQKRKDGLVKWAKMRREPFEKFQDFDSFIDEITVTNDQSWKNVEVVMGPDDEVNESDD